MEITWLEDFVALAEHMNFSRAAAARQVTQPAFGRRISALERWVGAPLVDRETHRLSLTAAGAQFLPVAEETIRRLRQGRREALDAANIAASLRFAATNALALTFFPAWLRQLGASVSTSAINLVADNMQGCEQIMLDGQAQFLLCHYHPAAATRLNPNDFASVRLGMDMLVPVTAPDGAGMPRHALPGSPEQPVSYLAFSEQSGMGRILAASWAQDGCAAHLKPVFTSHVAVVLKSLAADGRGVAWAPLSLVAEDLAAGQNLVRAGPGAWDIAMEIRLYRPRARQNGNAEAFWKMLKEAEAS
ncbi:LysR family transcriptional regulator [Ferrovibrio sp. MS7]|uniref:LysR family transcriptional regulator n=1 Tax=Ferrovibrio plantarum TaxID=3119164 RepID=UPI003135BBE3